MLFAAVHESGIGTNAKCRPDPEMSAVWGRPDISPTCPKRRECPQPDTAHTLRPYPPGDPRGSVTNAPSPPAGRLDRPTSPPCPRIIASAAVNPRPTPPVVRL